MSGFLHSGGEKLFRWRAGEITRLEGFSDAVFAFAVTLLVVSLEVPHSFHELMTVMSGFLAFAVCFAMLATIWYEHHIFFRRYGFQNVSIHALNLALLFVVLLYVYPLKFLFTLLVGQLLHLDPATLPEIARGESRSLLIIYGIGFAAVSLVFSLLYRYALQRSDELDLTSSERLLTKERFVFQSAYVAIGLASALFAWFLPERLEGIAGFTYLAIGPIRGAIASHYGKRARLESERALKAKLEPSAVTARHEKSHGRK
jgi:uncharacterized membrane protein